MIDVKIDIADIINYSETPLRKRQQGDLPERAMEVFHKMQQHGVVPNANTYS